MTTPRQTKGGRGVQDGKHITKKELSPAEHSRRGFARHLDSRLSVVLLQISLERTFGAPVAIAHDRRTANADPSFCLHGEIEERIVDEYC